MKKDVNTASILNLTASIGFYLASILFIIAAIIGKNFVYTTVGLAFLCCGTLFLILSMRNGKSNRDSENTGENNTDSKTDEEKK